MLSISSHKKYSFGMGFENIPLYLITRSFNCFEYFICCFLKHIEMYVLEQFALVSMEVHLPQIDSEA